MNGKTPFDFMPLEEAEKNGAIFEEILKQKKSIVDLENWHITRDGKEICFLTNGSPFFDNDGNLKGYRGVDRDITELKRAEKELKESLAYSENIFKSVIDMLIVVDQNGIIKTVNQAVTDILGYKEDELIGRSIVAIIAEEEEEEEEFFFFSRYCLGNVNKKGSIKNHDMIYKTKFGEKIPVSSAGSVMKDGEDKIVIFARDMREIRKMEKIINDREITLRNMYDSKLMGFLLWDADSEIIDSNDTFLKMLGYSREEFFSKNVFWQDITPIEYAERDSMILSNLAADKDVLPFEEEYICKDGSRLSVLVGATVLPDPGIGGAAFVLDVTERRKLETQLRQAEKMEAVGQLSGGIAHDFNNILAVILANAEVSLKNLSKEEDQTARKSLKEIVSASHHAKNVVKQLLFFARKTEIKKVPLKINILVRNALKLVRATLPSTIAVHTYISKRTGTVYADPTQINQVLLNLCTNAAHAMEEKGGTIKIHLSDIALDEVSAMEYENLIPGRYVQLTVSDTGHGIKAEHKKQLFEPYFTTKPVDKGTGLGLAVIHGIVKDLGGEILVESKSEIGTTFKILFPQTEKEPVLQKIKVVSKELPQIETARILLIDDEVSVLRSMQLILQMRGFQVEVKNAPMEALKLLQSDPKKFDIIITDMTMPIMCGDELAVEALKIRHNIPIILATGFNDKIDEKRAKEIGIRKYIEKPFSEEEIVLAIHEAMGV